MQYLLDHRAVTPRAAQTGLHNGAATRRLKEIEIRKNDVVHHERQVVRHARKLGFGARAQQWIDRSLSRLSRPRSARCDFVHGRRLGKGVAIGGHGLRIVLGCHDLLAQGV